MSKKQIRFSVKNVKLIVIKKSTYINPEDKRTRKQSLVLTS